MQRPILVGLRPFIDVFVYVQLVCVHRDICNAMVVERGPFGQILIQKLLLCQWLCAFVDLHYAQADEAVTEWMPDVSYLHLVPRILETAMENSKLLSGMTWDRACGFLARHGPRSETVVLDGGGKPERFTKLLGILTALMQRCLSGFAKEMYDGGDYLGASVACLLVQINCRARKRGIPLRAFFQRDDKGTRLHPPRVGIGHHYLDYSYKFTNASRKRKMMGAHAAKSPVLRREPMVDLR